jgi:hypothetical protein
MKFYELTYFEDDSQKNPSIQDFRSGYDTDAVNSATKIHHFQKIDFVPDLDFVLDKEGKATDLFAVSFVGSDHIFASERLYGILNRHNILVHQRFEAVVRATGKLLPYHFLHFYFRFDSDENDVVDLELTKFVAKKPSFPLSLMATPTEEEGVVGEFQVRSWREYHELRDREENDFTHKVVLPSDTLHIKKASLLALDLFFISLGNFGEQFIISERLAQALIDESVTGVKIKPLPFEIAGAE